MERPYRVLRLIFSLIVVAAMIISCAPPTQAPTQAATDVPPQPTKAVVQVATATQPPTEAAPPAFTEAPELAEQVKAGTLPPVEERLPENPLVVKPNESIGKYGGTLYRMTKPTADNAHFSRTISYENLVRWTPDWSGIIPNMAESYEVNEDATVYTFHLRKGIKWSDGEPWTSKDIMFWYNDVAMNTDLSPAPPSWLKMGDEVAKFEAPDDFTLVVTFPGPNGLFLSRLCTPDTYDVVRIPMHWAKKWHVDYADPAELEAMMKEGQYETWKDLFLAKVTNGDGVFQQPDRPVIWPWKITEGYVGGAQQVVFERNPYYWKVDTEGQQLPYVDKYIFQILDSVDAMVPKALAGEIQFQERHINTNPNKPLFFDNQEKGDYRFFTIFDGSLNLMTIMFNLSTTDPVKSEIFNNKDFRIGLSYAINRQEIIDTVYVGVGTPWQTAPKENSPFYDEQMATQYTEFSIEKANEHLDKAGYEKNASGKRLGPDGKPISFIIEVMDTNPQWIDMLNMVKTYWEAVGVDMQVKVEERSLLYTNKDANLLEGGVWSTSGFLAEVLLDPRYIFPYSTESQWAVCWSQWYNGAPEGKDCEPPDVVKEQFAIYDKIKSTADVEEQIALGKDLLAIARDEFWTIGIGVGPDLYGIVGNKVHNVIDHPSGWLYPNPAPINLEQIWLEE